MMLKRRWIIAVLVIFLTTGLVSARELLQHEECTIGADEVKEGNIFVLCRTLIIDGKINGNLLGGAVEIVINGEIYGNVFLVGGQLQVYGHISQDLHFAGLLLTVSPTAETPESTTTTETPSDVDEKLRGIIGGDLMNVSLSTTLTEDTSVGGSFVTIGYQLMMGGDVGGEVNFWGSALTISGRIDGNIYATVGDPQSDSSQLETLLLPLPFEVKLVNPGLIVQRGALIRGILQYTGPTAGRIDGRLLQDVDFRPELATPVLPLEEPASLGIYFEQVLREFWPLMVIGVIGLMLIPNWMHAPIPNLQYRPVSTFSIGMLTFILSFPVVLIGVLLSLFVLVILAILRLDSLLVAALALLGVVNLGGMAIFYFVAIFVARVIFCLALGRWLVRVMFGSNQGSRLLYLSLFVGVIVLSISGSLPGIGWIFNAMALFLGLGTILIVWLEYFSRLRGASLIPTPGVFTPSPFAVANRWAAPSALPVMPPLLDEPRAGTENLPEGFDFTFFNDE